MVSQLIRLSVRTLDGEEIGPFEVLTSDRIARLASLVRGFSGAKSPWPQFVWKGTTLASRSLIEDVDLVDGATVEFVWRPVVNQPPKRGVDVLPVRTPLNIEELRTKMLQVDANTKELDLAGHLLVGVPLADHCSSSILALDVRQCRMLRVQEEALFAVLPASLTSLHASHNSLSMNAVLALITRCGKLKVLDVGNSDDYDGEEIEVASLLPLLGECTEERDRPSLSKSPEA